MRAATSETLLQAEKQPTTTLEQRCILNSNNQDSWYVDPELLEVHLEQQGDSCDFWDFYGNNFMHQSELPDHQLEKGATTRTDMTIFDPATLEESADHQLLLVEEKFKKKTLKENFGPDSDNEDDWTVEIPDKNGEFDITDTVTDRSSSEQLV